MKLTDRRIAAASFVLASALFVACNVLACYPDASAPVCSAPTGLRTEMLACDALEAHERIAGPAFAQHTGRSDVSGWLVVVRSDVKWSEKYGRLYFTDDVAPGWLLWGMVDAKAGVIYLADDRLWTGVLAHESCHVLWPGRPHEDWPALGCDRVEARVRLALTPASGAFTAGPVEHGVLDPSEAL